MQNNCTKFFTPLLLSYHIHKSGTMMRKRRELNNISEISEQAREQKLIFFVFTVILVALCIL